MNRNERDILQRKRKENARKTESTIFIHFPQQVVNIERTIFFFIFIFIIPYVLTGIVKLRQIKLQRKK